MNFSLILFLALLGSVSGFGQQCEDSIQCDDNEICIIPIGTPLGSCKCEEGFELNDARECKPVSEECFGQCSPTQICSDNLCLDCPSNYEANPEVGGCSEIPPVCEHTCHEPQEICTSEGCACSQDFTSESKRNPTCELDCPYPFYPSPDGLFCVTDAEVIDCIPSCNEPKKGQCTARGCFCDDGYILNRLCKGENTCPSITCVNPNEICVYTDFGPRCLDPILNSLKSCLSVYCGNQICTDTDIGPICHDSCGHCVTHCPPGTFPSSNGLYCK